MTAKLESYAGVPHLKGDPVFNSALGRIVKSTPGAGDTAFGGFSALLDIGKFNFKNPMLVSSTDGVGTKLDIAGLTGKHDTIGIDLVAMCVNDLITCGAKPVLFLDYFATGKFDQKTTLDVIRGIAEGCRQSDCPLLGGETAIMPGFYPDARYDLAGFSVGLVEKSCVIDGRQVRAGDTVLGLASSGFHSNGYSLLRKVFNRKELSGKIGRELLVPTKIYVKPILDALTKVTISAIANITGGGMYDNLPRVLPQNLTVRIQKKSWPASPLFAEVAKRAKYTERQMFHTFNMGIGMVVIVPGREVKMAKSVFEAHDVRTYEIGKVVSGSEIVIE